MQNICGKNEQAIVTCLKSIEINPNFADAYNNRGAANRILYDPTANDAEVKISGVEVTGISFKQS